MKNLLLLSLILLVSCSDALPQGQKVHSMVKQRRPTEWYQEQADAWKSYLGEHPSDGDAWLNYYTAMRMLKIQAGVVTDDQLNEIVDELGEAIPETFEYYYIKQWQDGYRNYEQRQEWLKKAYALQPDRPELFDDLLTEYVVEGDKVNAKKIASNWFKSNDISPGLLTWNYNVLQSTDQNAILITVGDNDTYPAWVLQMHHGVRTDVKVMNASLLVMDRYREQMFEELGIPQMDQTLAEVKDYHSFTQMIFQHLKQHLPDRPFYFATSASPKLLEEIEDSLYNVGMAQRWSTLEFDNIAVMRRNYEQRYMLDYLQLPLTNDISQGVVDHMNTNYLVSMFTLHNHYVESGDPKASELERLIRIVGERSEMSDEIEKMLNTKKKG